MKNRAFRPVAVTVSLLLMLAVPAQASPVQINEVTQVVSASQRSGGQNASVSLRFLAQDDNATAGNATTSTSDSSASGDSSSSGVTTSVQDPTGGAVIQTDVTEDIGVEECECGPFEVPVAGFPKWPFIPLVGLVCLVPDLCTKCTPKQGEDANCKPVTITDCTTTGTCPQVPEPASLVLFGSGMAALGASMRRRRAQAKEAQAQEAAAANISGSK
ncbi:MAG TPA: PEP-CTERM sorting domain-containing protein [Pyrinomonadaceae bacterium]